MGTLRFRIEGVVIAILALAFLAFLIAMVAYAGAEPITPAYIRLTHDLPQMRLRTA